MTAAAIGRMCTFLAGFLLLCAASHAEEVLLAGERLSPQHFALRDVSARPALRSVLDELEYNDARTVSIYRRDLDDDGQTDDLIRAAPGLCGNGGCPYVLVDGRTQQVIGRFFAGTLIISHTPVGGFPVVYGISHVSADTSEWSCSVFDGRAYLRVVNLPLTGAVWNRFRSAVEDLPLAAQGE